LIVLLLSQHCWCVFSVTYHYCLSNAAMQCFGQNIKSPGTADVQLVVSGIRCPAVTHRVINDSDTKSD